MARTDDIHYEALRTRDARFDGKFFVGVKTTGIYCRPICPAKPRRENVAFFPNAIEAERAGYRPCLRCRPETAPLSPAWIGKSAIVRRAVKMLHHPETLHWDENRFAAQFGVSARHLRRLFIEEIGKTPKQLSYENRLNLARRLIVETRLPLTEVGHAAGFSSIRRFNDSFQKRFERSPREIRRSPLGQADQMVLSVPYRPPFDFEGLMQSYRSHQRGDLEWFTDTKMNRLIHSGGRTGVVSISHEPERSRLLVEIDFPDATVVHSVITRVRALFDLDSDPLVVANALERDPGVRKLLRKYPGIRLASGWDPFETAVSAILGQLVSVAQGRKLVHQLIELTGRESGFERDGRKVKLFPRPADLAKAPLTGLGTTLKRKESLRAFARAVAEGSISLEPTQEVEQFLRSIQKMPGIGAWTASILALKVLRHTDAFPASDLILKRALPLHSREAISGMGPWRGYVAALFWREYARTPTERAVLAESLLKKRKTR